MFRLQSIRAILLALVLAVSVPLALAMLYSWWHALEHGRGLQLRLLQSRVIQVDHDLQNLWNDAAWALPRIAARPIFVALSPRACADEMAVVQDIDAAFLGITLWAPDGRLICSTLPPRAGQPAPAPHRPTFDEGLATPGLYLSNIFAGPITGLQLVALTYPVKNGTGEVVGLLSMPVRAEYFETMLSTVDRHDGVVVGIVDRALNLIARVPGGKAWRGTSVAHLPGVRASIGREVSVFETTGVDGIRRIVAQKATVQGWRVYVGIEDAILFAEFRRQLLRDLGLFFLVVVLSMGLVWRIARGMTRPLNDLIAVADAVAQGDRAIRAALPEGGELAHLARQINRMLDALAESERRLRESELSYRALAESSPDATLIHQDHIIVFVNREMVRLMRASSAADLVGKFVSLLPPEQAEAGLDRARAIYAGEPQPLVERVYIRLDGTPVDVEVASAPVTFNGKPAAEITVRDITERKRADRLLRESMARARELSARLLVAEEAERKRIAHDLHDQLGQELTAIKIRLDTLTRAKASPDVHAQLIEAAQAAGEALKRVREMSVDLRPPQLDNLGLAAALRSHVQRLASTGSLEIEFDSRGANAALPPEIEIVAFRVVQEALTNTMRHSGAAHAWVTLSATGKELRVEVRDDGAGFDVDQVLQRTAAQSGIGLYGMRERVALAGGTLDIRSAPGQGCAIVAIFPLPNIVVP